MKTLQNSPFFTFPDPVGCDEPLFPHFRLQILNKLNGFVHNSYGMALKNVRDWH
jgi:hypothetical protein